MWTASYQLSRRLTKPNKDTGDGFETAMRSAHLEDSGDCIKRLLCELQSKKDQDLPWDEILIKKSVASKIDYMSPILQLQLAVDLGTKQGPKQCSVVYSRCAFDSDVIMELMRQQGTSLELSGSNQLDSHECTVLFLWNKKSNAMTPTT